MGLGPSLHLKPIEGRAEIASKCPVRACSEASTPRYASLPPDAGRALAAGLVAGHTAVAAARVTTLLRQLPAPWLRAAADLMRRVHQQRSAVAVALARRLQETHPEFRCTDVAPSRAFPRYWSCGVMLDNYLSLALGEMPPRFHLHIDDLKLQDVSEAFSDVVASHYPELIDKNGRCMLKKFLKRANDVLNTIERGEHTVQDDAAVQVDEDDPEFPPQDENVYWSPKVTNRCGGRGRGTCPHVFCEYRAHLPHYNF